MTASVGALLIATGVGATSSVLFDAIPGWVVYFTWAIAAFGMGLVFTIVQHAALDAAPVGREVARRCRGRTGEHGRSRGRHRPRRGVVRGEAGSLQTRFAVVFGCCTLAALAASITARRLPLATPGR